MLFHGQKACIYTSTSKPPAPPLMAAVRARRSRSPASRQPPGSLIRLHNGSQPSGHPDGVWFMALIAKPSSQSNSRPRGNGGVNGGVYASRLTRQCGSSYWDYSTYHIFTGECLELSGNSLDPLPEIEAKLAKSRASDVAVEAHRRGPTMRGARPTIFIGSRGFRWCGMSRGGRNEEYDKAFFFLKMMYFGKTGVGVS